MRHLARMQTLPQNTPDFCQKKAAFMTFTQPVKKYIYTDLWALYRGGGGIGLGSITERFIRRSGAYDSSII